jgi:hypothetical protein
MNFNYEKIYRVYSNIPWYLKSDLFGMGPKLFIGQFERGYNDELETIYKQQFPKKKKVDLTLLPEDIIKPIREKWQGKFACTYAKKNRQIHLLRNLLDSLAKDVVIIPNPDLTLLKTACSSNWNSQGWGANKYAKQSLNGDIKLLERFGYCYEVKPVLAWDDDPKCNSYNYQLWTNLSDWQYDCITRKESFDELQWACDCWKSGVNPKVYNPFMDNEIYDKSLEVWRN